MSQNLESIQTLEMEFMNCQIKSPFLHKTWCEHYFEIEFWKNYTEQCEKTSGEILVNCPQCGEKTI